MLGVEYILPIEDLVLGYALTTTKSQGSEWDHVLMIDGTSNLNERNRDRYVMVTRSGVSLKILVDSKAQLEIGVVDGALALLDRCEEGDRNTSLYRATKELFGAIKDIALDKGLEEQEVDKTMLSAVSTPTSNISSRSKRSFDLNSFPLLENPRLEKWYTPVFPNHKTLKGADQILTLEEAEAYEGKLYVAEQLKGSNRIVIDCDSKETVELFLRYKDLTESYYSEDSMYLVFTTDRIIPSQRYNKLDIQGNKTLALRHIKPNKQPNGLEAIPLTQDVLDIVRGVYENPNTNPNH